MLGEKGLYPDGRPVPWPGLGPSGDSFPLERARRRRSESARSHVAFPANACLSLALTPSAKCWGIMESQISVSIQYFPVSVP